MTTVQPESAQRPGSELLRPYRVLDLTNELGELAGRILADLGADVIKVEPPDGDASRWRPPFFGDRPDPEASLPWWASNLNKRGITLDLHAAQGQALFRRLVQTADFVLESFPPGYLDGLGLGYSALAELNPRVILTSITPFGQTGPYAQFPATDLTLQALGGFLYVNGDADRPPVRISADLAYRHGGGQGAAGSLVAHYQRQRTGRGQHVDVSIQDYIAWTPLNVTFAAQVQHANTMRQAVGFRAHTVGVKFRFTWPCKDGRIAFRPLVTGGGKAQYEALVKWMTEEGFGEPILTARDWAGSDNRAITQDEYNQIAAVIERFLRTRTLDELYEKAVQLRFRLAPAATAKDMVESRQIQARGLLVSVAHPAIDRTVIYPGPFARFTATPIENFRRPPLLGEDNVAIVAELDSDRGHAHAAVPFAGDDALTSANVSSPVTIGPHEWQGSATLTRPGSGGGVFAGLKIVDFTWAAAGPITTRHFGDFGATVVKIESSKHPDSLRVGPPFVDGKPGINRSGFFAQFNPNKLSVTVDMTNPVGREVTRKLILEWADVVVDSFTPRVMPGWGLSYAELSQARPDLIMLSTCMQGQTGPYRDYAGFGDQGAALSGFFMLNGWPDRDPATPNGAYTDMATPHFGAAAILAALDFRARTGRGQHIDLSQIECGIQFLAPEVLDYTVRGHVPQRMGNRSLRAAPHGVFPVKGEDAWIAIVCETDAQWQAFVVAIGSPDWAADSAYRTLAGRLERQEAIEGYLADWTRHQPGADLQYRLLAAGVPSGVASPALDLFEDPQFLHRQHFVPLEHAEMGVWKYDELGVKLPDSPAHLCTAAPLLGEHTELVLKQFLGYSDADYQALVEAGALQ
jgi:crotonobetainyl-CoA:carnitine CoA-transferase CaiB-like acyl-CoA transferase